MYSEKKLWRSMEHDVSGCKGILSITREKVNEIKNTLESLSVLHAALF